MDKRPGASGCFEASLKKGMALVSYSLSRLARSTKDAISIGETVAKKQGRHGELCTEQIDTTTAAGKMMFQMLSVLAEFERNLTAERTTDAHCNTRRRTGQKYTNHHTLRL
jgi:site-specific DNA recombinase